MTKRFIKRIALLTSSLLMSISGAISLSNSSMVKALNSPNSGASFNNNVQVALSSETSSSSIEEEQPFFKDYTESYLYGPCVFLTRRVSESFIKGGLVISVGVPNGDNYIKTERNANAKLVENELYPDFWFGTEINCYDFDIYKLLNGVETDTTLYFYNIDFDQPFYSITLKGSYLHEAFIFCDFVIDADPNGKYFGNFLPRRKSLVGFNVLYPYIDRSKGVPYLKPRIEGISPHGFDIAAFNTKVGYEIVCSSAYSSSEMVESVVYNKNNKSYAMMFFNFAIDPYYVSYGSNPTLSFDICYKDTFDIASETYSIINESDYIASNYEFGYAQYLLGTELIFSKGAFPPAVFLDVFNKRDGVDGTYCSAKSVVAQTGGEGISDKALFLKGGKNYFVVTMTKGNKGKFIPVEDLFDFSNVLNADYSGLKVTEIESAGGILSKGVISESETGLWIPDEGYEGIETVKVRFGGDVTRFDGEKVDYGFSYLTYQYYYFDLIVTYDKCLRDVIPNDDGFVLEPESKDINSIIYYDFDEASRLSISSSACCSYEAKYCRLTFEESSMLIYDGDTIVIEPMPRLILDFGGLSISSSLTFTYKIFTDSAYTASLNKYVSIEIEDLQGNKNSYKSSSPMNSSEVLITVPFGMYADYDNPMFIRVCYHYDDSHIFIMDDHHLSYKDLLIRMYDNTKADHIKMLLDLLETYKEYSIKDTLDKPNITDYLSDNNTFSMYLNDADALRRYSIYNEGFGPHFTHLDMKIDDQVYFNCAITAEKPEEKMYVTEYRVDPNNKNDWIQIGETHTLISDEYGMAYFETSPFYYANFLETRVLVIETSDAKTSMLTVNGFEYIYLGLKDKNTDDFTKNVLCALENFVFSIWKYMDQLQNQE